MRRANQRAMLLAYMREIGPVTTMQAIRSLNILKPSNRISELKALGHQINTEIIWKTRKDGSITHYAKYTLVEEKA